MYKDLQELISIVDEPEQFKFSDVDDSVVSIGKKYYWRSSTRIVRIAEKNNRYFRKASPYVVRDYKGEYRLKSYCVQLDEGRYV